MPGDPHREWLTLLEAELVRRQAQADWEARDGERQAQRLLDQLEVMAGRFAVSTRPGDAELAEKLAQAAQAKDWNRVEELRILADVSPAEAVALVSTVNPKTAMRLLEKYAVYHAGESELDRRGIRCSFQTWRRKQQGRHRAPQRARRVD